MAHWLDDYPALRVMRRQMAAESYNRVRLGLLRERLPWRLCLADFRCLYCILDEAAWVCVDECQNSLPILAWTNFKTAQRNALDAPVDCELRLYHMHAGLIMGTALEALARAAVEHHDGRSSAHAPVSELKVKR